MNLDTIVLWLARSGDFKKVVTCPGISSFVVPNANRGLYQFVDLTDEGENYTCHTVDLILTNRDETEGIDISDYELVFWATDGIVTHYTFDTPGANDFYWCDHLPESIGDLYRGQYMHILGTYIYIYIYVYRRIYIYIYIYGPYMAPTFHTRCC